MTRLADVYARGTTYYLMSESHTVDWLWLAQGPVAQVEASDDDDTLGTAARSALDASTVDIERPADLRHLLDPLVARAGLRSLVMP